MGYLTSYHNRHSWDRRKRETAKTQARSLRDIWQAQARDYSDADLDKAITDARDVVKNYEKAQFIHARQWANNGESLRRWQERLDILTKERTQRTFKKLSSETGNAALWLLFGLIVPQLIGVYCIVSPVLDLFNRLPKF